MKELSGVSRLSPLSSFSFKSILSFPVLSSMKSHQDRYLSSLFKSRRYYSWLLECPSSQREIECDKLRSLLQRLNLSFYERFESDTSNPQWRSIEFPSLSHDDIKYQLCIETFNSYLYKECKRLAKENTYSQLFPEEIEREKINYSLLSTEREYGNVDEIRYPKFNDMTLYEYEDYLFKKYLKNPPSSIPLEVGFSASHISSNSVLGIGIVDEENLDTPSTLRVISRFLDLENEFLPLFQSQELPSKRQRKRLSKNENTFLYKKYRKVNRDTVSI